MHLTKIPSEPRYERTKHIANVFLVKQNLARLPINPFEVAKQNNWPISSIINLCKMSGASLSVIKSLIKNSNDGGTIYCSDTNEYHIIFNNLIRSTGRIRWTLMHEIGHIVLNHLVDFHQTRISRKGLTRNEYAVLEQEADYFAAHVLAPPIVLYKMGIKSSKEIFERCKLSKEASQNRKKHLDKWSEKPRVDPRSFKVLLNFRDYIYQKKCTRCDFRLVSTKAKCCPICGKELIWGEGKLIYDDGFMLDEDGRALECPRCKNEELEYEGDYCKICGVLLVNKCPDILDYDINDTPYVETEGCGIAQGNARHCIKCGAETTYSKNGLLTSWKNINNSYKAEAIAEAAASYEEDDEFPF